MTIAEWIVAAAARLDGAGLHFGHGTDNARDEAAWLVLHAVGAPLDGSFAEWGRTVGAEAESRIRALLDERCNNRRPLAYLLGTAWFAGLEFEVGPQVLVPRSPIAELVVDGFRPWARPGGIRRMLDLCTGSGCIAVASAVHLPGAEVVASDISPAALEVAARNVRRHGVGGRVRLVESDLFRDVPDSGYDLIVANPPYVPEHSLGELPAEHRAEPALGLVSGPDGLDAALSILVDAPAFLGEDGVLVCEVGESKDRLAAALPGVPFLWLEFAHGGSGVFVLDRAQLVCAGSELAELMGKRSHVV